VSTPTSYGTGKTPGCSDKFDDVGLDAQALARLFATHAAIALGHAQERASFTEGLKSRRAIGQSIGILMERYDMNEDRAFAFLVRASSHRNIKLRAIAQELVEEANAHDANEQQAALIATRSAERSAPQLRDSRR
jgi:hypothetical protein